MENSMFVKIIATLFFTILVVIGSVLGVGPILGAMLNPSAGASNDLITYALLIGLIFTVIFCTILTLERLKK